jgi:PAS domain S-box-containing protein
METFKKIFKIENEDDRKRFLIYFFTSTALLALLAFGIRRIIDNRVLYSAIIFLFFTVALINILILKYIKKIGLSAHIVLALMFVLEIVLFCSLDEGTSALLWYYIFPPLAITLIDNKRGTIYSIFLIVVTLVLVLIKPEFLTNSYPKELIIRFVFTYIVMGILINIFEYSRKVAYRAYLSKLAVIKEKNKDLISAKIKLNQYNEQLSIAKDKTDESETYLHNIINNVGDPIFVKDEQKRHVLVNDAFCEMFGLSKNDIIDKTLGEEIAPEEMKKFMRIDNQVLSNGKENISEELLTVKDNKTLTISTRKRRFIDDSGKKHLIGVVRDISERKLAENELKFAKEQAEESKNQLKELNLRKDRLFSIIGHDLRGPIGGFKQLIDYLVSDDFDLNETETLSKLLQTLQGTANTTYDLLENLLLWARTQQNEITFSPVNCDLNEVTTKTISLLQELAIKKNIIVINKILKKQTVYADVNMLTTILRNLISNAIKFIPNDKSISVSINKNKNYWVISVKDEGIGISPEDINKIFNPNLNFTNFGTNNEKGSGLGLLICHEFVKKHNGKIWIESEEGKGSDFKFTLPLNK